jgi:hypothetical protein
MQPDPNDYVTDILPPPPRLDDDAAWQKRKDLYRKEYGYGCRRCLKAGIQGDPDEWLHLHHLAGKYRIWDYGKEPDHALMWLCQEHHKALHRAHGKFCRWVHPRIMHGNDIRHPAGYSITLYVWSILYVYSGRAFLTAGARAASYLAGVFACSLIGPPAFLLVLAWPAHYLWRKT